MIFSKNIYISTKAKLRKNDIEKLKNNKPVAGMYIILVNLKSNNLFEIMDSYYFFRKRHNLEDYKIIAILTSKKACFLHVKKIFENFLPKGLENIKEYYF
ncbi:MAG: hypothetical protein ACK5LT_08385 [Lachnospirales bacterium]